MASTSNGTPGFVFGFFSFLGLYTGKDRKYTKRPIWGSSHPPTTMQTLLQQLREQLLRSQRSRGQNLCPPPLRSGD
jgi:hypothetical protein